MRILAIVATTVGYLLTTGLLGADDDVGRVQIQLNVHTFTVPDDCEIQQVAGPPLVNRPISADFDELGRAIVRKARRVILLGSTAAKIEDAVHRAGRDWPRLPLILRARDLSEASRVASASALPGEVVLLSPACASFDQFRNFQERGEVFANMAKAMAGHAA